MCRYFSVVMLLSLVAAIGCGPGYKIVSVSGTITMDGKPLADAMILTQPIGTEDNVTPGPGSFARTDSEGRFVLEFQHEDVVGAVPGECTVKIKEVGEKKASSDDTVDAAVLRSKVPLDYQEGKITYTIPEEGTDAMDFDIQTRKR